MKQIIPMLLALLLFSCKDSSINDQIPNGSSIIFEIEYVNYAWGISYHGIMIDNEGKEYSYDPAKDTIPFLYHADGFYTDQELQAKYGHVKTYIKTIRSDSLNWSHNLANQVTITNYSDTTRVGVDAGSETYSAYIFRPQINKYQQIILKVDGDYSFYNKSQSAITLAAWLKQH
ncbi:MAG: hypothetical protein Q8N83_17645 [Ignavibacteria bacterium]|nr:hypothetical protein [Ignavibacteria bacterium]